MFLTDVVNGFKVQLYMYSSDGSKVSGDYSLSNGEGVTCNLTKGEAYTIKVSSYSNTGDYLLCVGQQKATIDISSHEVLNDSIEYVDQKNNYRFIPEISGVYHFSFSNVASGFRLQLYIYDSLGYKVNGDYSIGNNEGITFNLEANQEYDVAISYYTGFGDYSLSIGKRNPSKMFLEIIKYQEQ